MIKDERELHQSLEQLGRMYQALAALRAEVLPKDPALFRVMAEGPIDQIDELTREIREFSGAGALSEPAIDVWLRVEGRGIVWPDAPSSVLTAVLDAFRKGAQIVAELLSAGRLTARPTAELQQLCDFPVAALQHGSMQIGLRVPHGNPRQSAAGASAEQRLVERAVTQLLDVAAWVASEEDEARLVHSVADPAQRRIVLNALKPILPRARGRVDSVVVSGRLAPKQRPIVLTRTHHARIDAAIDRTIAERIEAHEGDLREIDLDARTFVLRHAGDVQEIRCSFGDEVLETAKAALDRRVRVTGSLKTTEGRRSLTSLMVTRLEVLEPDGEGGLLVHFIPGEEDSPANAREDTRRQKA